MSRLLFSLTAANMAGGSPVTGSKVKRASGEAFRRAPTIHSGCFDSAARCNGSRPCDVGLLANSILQNNISCKRLRAVSVSANASPRHSRGGDETATCKGSKPSELYVSVAQNSVPISQNSLGIKSTPDAIACSGDHVSSSCESVTTLRMSCISLQRLRFSSSSRKSQLSQ